MARRSNGAIVSFCLRDPDRNRIDVFNYGGSLSC